MYFQRVVKDVIDGNYREGNKSPSLQVSGDTEHRRLVEGRRRGSGGSPLPEFRGSEPPQKQCPFPAAFCGIRIAGCLF